QADQQHSAATADRDPRRPADRNRRPRPARSLPLAALRPHGRGDDGPGPGRSLAALAGAVRRVSAGGPDGDPRSEFGLQFIALFAPFSLFCNEFLLSCNEWFAISPPESKIPVPLP